MEISRDQVWALCRITVSRRWDRERTNAAMAAVKRAAASEP